MFEELENTLKTILQEVKDQKELLQIVLTSLTTSKQVASFLGVSQRTIEGWVKKGIFIEGVHFNRSGKRLVFNPDAIIEFKRNRHKNKNKNVENKDIPPKINVINPTAKRIVEGLKKVHNG